MEWQQAVTSRAATKPQWPFEVERPGIECATRSRCWAVGDDEGGTQAVHWNGQHWSLVPAPDPGGAGFLFDVACLGHTDCLAVGFSHVPPTQNLAVHWNGRKWRAT